MKMTKITLSEFKLIEFKNYFPQIINNFIHTLTGFSIQEFARFETE
jgi:hypothetical protein